MAAAGPDATLRAIFEGAAGSAESMTIKEFRTLWQRLNLPFLPDHSACVEKAFCLIDTDGQGYFSYDRFVNRLQPLLEFIESKSAAPRARERRRVSTDMKCTQHSPAIPPPLFNP